MLEIKIYNIYSFLNNLLQSLDGRPIRVDEAGKGGRPRGGFQTNQRAGRFGGSRGRGGRGYSRGENQLSILRI